MLSECPLADAWSADWNLLSDEAQLAIAGSALRQATEMLARQAETLADEIDIGTLADYGGADALRLFAAIVRSGRSASGGGIGHA
jgi:hypothetical protein